MNDANNTPDPCIEALKRLARLNKEEADPNPNQPVEELALWRVASTRQAIIEKGKFSPEEIQQLDKLASGSADAESEGIARHSARHFQSGVRFEAPDHIEEKNSARENE